MNEPTFKQLADSLQTSIDRVEPSGGIIVWREDMSNIVDALRRAEAMEKVVEAVKELGCIPDGYCFCFCNTQAPDYVHTGECVNLCHALTEVARVEAEEHQRGPAAERMNHAPDQPRRYPLP